MELIGRIPSIIVKGGQSALEFLEPIIYISKTVSPNVCVRLFLSGEHNTLEGSIGMAGSGMWNVCNFKQVVPVKRAKQLVL